MHLAQAVLARVRQRLSVAELLAKCKDLPAVEVGTATLTCCGLLDCCALLPCISNALTYFVLFGSWMKEHIHCPSVSQMS